MGNYLSLLCAGEQQLHRKYTHKSIFTEVVCVRTVLDKADSVQCVAQEPVIREESSFIQYGSLRRM